MRTPLTEQPPTSVVNEAFGQALRSARARAGLTQDELAEKASMARNSISLLERGARSPTLSTLVALSLALDINTSDLVIETEQYLSVRRACIP